MTTRNHDIINGIVGRDADIDIVVAEFVSDRKQLQATVEELKSRIEALKGELAGKDQKLVSMQNAMDLYMLDYESKANED